jgi:hypothetical protein
VETDQLPELQISGRQKVSRLGHLYQSPEAHRTDSRILMKKAIVGLMQIPYAFVGIIITFPILMFRAYVDMSLLNWFFVPMLHSRHVTWPMAFSLRIIIQHYMTFCERDSDKTVEEAWSKDIATVLVRGVFAYLLGAILHRWFWSL